MNDKDKVIHLEEYIEVLEKQNRELKTRLEDAKRVRTERIGNATMV